MRLGANRSILVAVLTGVVLIAIWTVSRSRREATEVIRIQSRYEELRTALVSANTNAAREFFAPDVRGGAHRSFALLQTFSKPLGVQSSVKILGSRAQICPERLYHFGVVPGGHTIEMVQIEGDWFFTGAVDID
ncbi:MAG: hypothetical protein J0M24_07370 [Verrucomicrobia bacterium]|nr:hypothetical protein [Verrucomicrobiota bacterium]